MLVSILSCRPVQYEKDLLKRNAHCISASGFVLTNTIPDIATDIAILLLPLPVIWNLQLRVKKKIAMTAIFSIGIL